jgi:hypothetical protein
MISFVEKFENNDKAWCFDCAIMEDEDEGEHQSWLENKRLCRAALCRDLVSNNPDITEVTLGNNNWVEDEEDLLGAALMNNEVVSSVIFNLCEMSEEFYQFNRFSRISHRDDLDPERMKRRMASLLAYLSALQKVSLLCHSDDEWNNSTGDPCIGLMCDLIFTALAKRPSLTHFDFRTPGRTNSLCAFLTGSIRIQMLTIDTWISMGDHDMGDLEIAQAIASQSDLAVLRMEGSGSDPLVLECLKALCGHETLKKLVLCAENVSFGDEEEIMEPELIVNGLRMHHKLVRLELLYMPVERYMEVILSSLFDHHALEEIVLCPESGLLTSPPLTLSNLLRSPHCRIEHVVLEGFAFDAESWKLLLDSIEARSPSTALTVRRCSFSVGFSSLLALSLPQSTKLSELTMENLNLTDIHASTLLQVFCQNGSLLRANLDGMSSEWSQNVAAYGQRNQYCTQLLPEVGIDGCGCISLLPLVYASALKAPRMAPTTILIGLLAWKDSFKNHRHKRVVPNLEL